MVVDKIAYVAALKVSHFFITRRQRRINANKKRSIIIIPAHPNV
jgi:hypothetical protein